VYLSSSPASLEERGYTLLLLFSFFDPALHVPSIVQSLLNRSVTFLQFLYLILFPVLHLPLFVFLLCSNSTLHPYPPYSYDPFPSLLSLLFASQAFMLPNVMNYAVAFGFFKLVWSCCHVTSPLRRLLEHVTVASYTMEYGP
jgi:hypothetical protein